MLEHDDSKTATLLGFLIREGPEPVHLLEVSPGMSVLYGLNGAGKSRTLADVNRFFRGWSSDAIALIRLPPFTDSIDWYRETSIGDWFPDWAQRADMKYGDQREVVRAWVHACISADEVAMPGVPPTSSVHNPDRLEALIDEWMEERLILAQADGSDQQRRWVTAPAFVTSEAARSTSDEVELFEIYERLDASLDGFGEIALTPFGRTTEGETIACASHGGQPALEDAQVLFSAGVHDRFLSLEPTIFTSTEDVDAHTREHLLHRLAESVEVVDGRLQPSAALTSHASELETLANQHLLGVLQDAPILRLYVEPVGFGQQVQWFVAEDETWNEPSQVPRQLPTTAEHLPYVRTLAGLSTAQRRWAHWSIEMALSLLEGGAPSLPSLGTRRLFLLDEPEAALHRSAEAHMATYLTELAKSPDIYMMVATHSPELLETDTARVYEVSRQEGVRRLQILDSASRENMEQLGLQPSDLLRRQRGFILVEGLHDEVVLNELFGDQMRNLRVEALPLRGTTELSPAKISFLFDYTPARVFLMLDNIQTGELSDLWTLALDHHRKDETTEAVELIENAACLTTDEGRKLRAILTEVILNGHASRVTPHGLTYGDIVEYLPVEIIIGADEDWRDLRLLHKDRRTNAQKKTPKDFKRWLEQDYEADFGIESVRAAVRALDAPPPDLLRLWTTIEAHLSV